MKLNEKWKPVVGFEGLYEVSDEGRVRSLKFSKVKILKPGINSTGYLQVSLWKNGKMKVFTVHYLVVTTFKGPIPPGMQVNHVNENKLDNRLENLEVVTAKENLNWGTRNERARRAISKELTLTNAKSCSKYTFPSSYIASEFFGYKYKEQVGSLISNARQRGENFINIRGEKHYFSQEA